MADPTDNIADDAQIAAARVAGTQSLKGPRAIAARYLPGRDRVEIDLASGWSVQVPRSFSGRLAAASAQDCESVEIVDSGLGLHWPAIDEDWYVPAVIETIGIAHAA
jgi:hypothetical protein